MLNETKGTNLSEVVLRLLLVGNTFNLNQGSVNPLVTLSYSQPQNIHRNERQSRDSLNYCFEAGQASSDNEPRLNPVTRPLAYSLYNRRVVESRERGGVGRFGL